MLKQRVITAVVLASVFVLALVYLPGPLFSAFAATITLIGAWEWANLSGLSQRWQRGVYVLVVGGLLALGAVYLGVHQLPEQALDNRELLESQSLAFRNILMVGCVWWALALLWVQGYPSSALLWHSRWMRALMGFFVLVPAWAGLSYLRVQDSGLWLLVLLVAIVACADIGGYFAGRRWGKHKLAVSVSPGKTWEGFAGGVAANTLLALLVGYFWQGSVLFWLAIILPTSLVSVLGDLLESMVKRQRGIKDSSALLPGHGGVLDRVDSLTSAAPVFALALLAGGWPQG
ncbi:phosphatidate cytidylyltransferase [Marinimicrobium sp. C6131]|uniref:phosphatidate cytidylyltransferase n=1 Tax=Marinimicrobium sp. C6131 TaxID=3022676 RepID=UPI00223DBFD3|nr:phosphatidate cytidylyltransferase [Marinimicrobium sp. C6131]UZJ45847.1 phosphatidate cytidylyltransferase [Marinimicrobium sp. C6131]